MRTVAAVVALVVCVHAGLWMLLQRQQAVASIDAPLASISYSPYTRSQHPDYGDRPTAEQIRADLKILSPYTQDIRTYTSTGGGELVPAIAAEFGLKVTLGIWIDKNEARNEREIQAGIALARRYSNINAIVVGNETTLRAEKSIDELIRLVQRVKRQSPVPVTTGEIWTIWIEHPELASAGHGRGAAVLLRAVNPVRELVVGGYVVKLAVRLIVPGTPSFAAVERDDGALIRT